MNFAKVTAVTTGSVLIADAGFTCVKEGTELVVEADTNGDLFVSCDEGQHYLDGQLSADGQTYIGLTQKD